jgi:hypothetical protein
MMNINDDDLVLKPVSGLRGKRPHSLPKGNLVAFVWLDVSSVYDYSGKYEHPTLSLRVQYEANYGDGQKHHEDMELLEVRFQRNRLDGDGIKNPARGFLAGQEPGRWSISYGPKVSGDLCHRRLVQAGLDLLERANEATRYSADEKLCRSLSRKDCDLLTMIAGLQRIGVTVVVRRGKPAKLPRVELTAGNDNAIALAVSL